MPNQKPTAASVTFDYGDNMSGIALSNSTDFIDVESVSLEKYCLSENYFFGDNITYIIEIKNNSYAPLFNLKIKEDMGNTKTVNDSSSYSLLKYAENFKYYINGNSAEIADPKTYSDKIIFEIGVLAALSNAVIIYSAKVTENAPLNVGASITNCSSLIIPSTGKTLESSHTIKIRETADIKTIKQIKNFSGGTVTYGISIYNYGNIPAKNITVKNSFERKFSSLKVKIGSKILGNSDYTYSSNELQIPSYSSKHSISVPEARFIKDEISGKFGIIPGSMDIIIECKI